jgi:hypothetical protein
MKRVRGRDENRPREEIKCTDSLRAKSPGHCHSPQYIQSVCTVQNATPFICFAIYIYIYKSKDAQKKKTFKKLYRGYLLMAQLMHK